MVISCLRTPHYGPRPPLGPPPSPFFSIHTLIIAAEMLFAVSPTEFTTPSTAFAYCLIWTFPIENVPQLLMVCSRVLWLQSPAKPHLTRHCNIVQIRAMKLIPDLQIDLSEPIAICFVISGGYTTNSITWP